MKSATSRKVRRCAVLIDHTVSDLVYYFDKTCPIRKLNEMMGVKEDYYLASLFRKIVNNANLAIKTLKENDVK